MQLAQLEQNGHLIRSSSIRHPSSGKPVPLNTYVTHSVPMANSSRAPTNPYGMMQSQPSQIITNKESASRSVFVKGEGADMDTFMRDVKQKLSFMGKVLSEHEMKIMDLQGKRGLQGNKENWGDSVQIVKKNLSSREKSKGQEDRIFLEIEKLRDEIKSKWNGDQIQKDTGKVIMNLQQNMSIMESQIIGRIKELKEKTYSQLKLMNESFRKQLEQQIHNTQDINKTVFNKIQKDMIQLQKKIMNSEDTHSKDKSGKQRYLGVLQMIRFKEIVERQMNSERQAEGRQEVVINQGTYFLDKDGYLLDKEGYYITGDDDKWIQLNARQIKILRAYNILRE